MPLRKQYLPPVSPIVATYNYVDVAEGTGMTAFNAFTAEQSTGEKYMLTTSEPFSHLVSISGSLGTGVKFSGSFDTAPLNQPLLLKGSVIANITWRVTNSSSSNLNFPFVKLFKWDGSTATLIGEVSGASISSAGGVMRTTAMQISGIPSTLIKIGEQIRIQPGIEGVDAGNTPKGFIGCDPQNRADDWFTAGNFATTKLIANIPFQINTAQ